MTIIGSHSKKIKFPKNEMRKKCRKNNLENITTSVKTITKLINNISLGPNLTAKIEKRSRRKSEQTVVGFSHTRPFQAPGLSLVNCITLPHLLLSSSPSQVTQDLALHPLFPSLSFFRFFISSFNSSTLQVVIILILLSPLSFFFAFSYLTQLQGYTNIFPKWPIAPDPVT